MILNLRYGPVLVTNNLFQTVKTNAKKSLFLSLGYISTRHETVISKSH